MILSNLPWLPPTEGKLNITNKMYPSLIDMSFTKEGIIRITNLKSSLVVWETWHELIYRKSNLIFRGKLWMCLAFLNVNLLLYQFIISLHQKHSWLWIPNLLEKCSFSFCGVTNWIPRSFVFRVNIDNISRRKTIHDISFENLSLLFLCVIFRFSNFNVALLK